MKPQKLFCTHCGNLLLSTAESGGQPGPRPSETVYTFDCPPCQLRFQVSQQKLVEATDAQDRRKVSRIPVNVPVDLECGTLTGEGTITDISKGGCAIELNQPLTIGQLLRLKFPPPTGSVDNCATVKIVAVQNLRGQKAGMKFLTFTPEEQTRLTQTATKSIQFFPPPERRS